MGNPIEVAARDVHFARGGRVIMDALSCAFPRGGISVIAGASGSGKTTLLRMIACLIHPQRGAIQIDGGSDLAQLDPAGLQAFRRRVGMLFQGGALLDTLSIFDNVALPLREHSELPEASIREQVRRAFAAVGLEDVESLFPGELSGGMVKRAGLARALIEGPDLLLCDEPFSGLDPPTIRRIEELLQTVNRRVGATLIVTSHHNDSTLRIADHLVLLAERRAIEGPPRELVAKGDPRVAEFFVESAASHAGAAP